MAVIFGSDLILNGDDFAENAVEGDPAIHMAVVVADLILFAANCGDQMGEVVAADFAENGITHSNVLGVLYRTVCAFLPGFDPRHHAVSGFAETDRFSCSKTRDICLASGQYGLRTRSFLLFRLITSQPPASKGRHGFHLLYRR